MIELYRVYSNRIDSIEKETFTFSFEEAMRIAKKDDYSFIEVIELVTKDNWREVTFR